MNPKVHLQVLGRVELLVTDLALVLPRILVLFKFFSLVFLCVFFLLYDRTSNGSSAIRKKHVFFYCFFSLIFSLLFSVFFFSLWLVCVWVCVCVCQLGKWDSQAQRSNDGVGRVWQGAESASIRRLAPLTSLCALCPVNSPKKRQIFWVGEKKSEKEMSEKIEDLNLPNAVVTRIIKEAVPKGTIISKVWVCFGVFSRFLKLWKGRKTGHKSSNVTFCAVHCPGGDGECEW